MAAVLMAISSLIFVLPMVIGSHFMPHVDQHGNPIQSPAAMDWLFLVFPIGYLILGYLMSGFMCLVYNAIIKYLGGFEFDVTERQPEGDALSKLS
jgi:hypothetical protein